MALHPSMSAMAILRQLTIWNTLNPIALFVHKHPARPPFLLLTYEFFGMLSSFTGHFRFHN
jgi:hypothetical protein